MSFFIHIYHLTLFLFVSISDGELFWVLIRQGDEICRLGWSCTPSLLPPPLHPAGQDPRSLKALAFGSR